MPDQQPEPKQYPTADDHGFCPFTTVDVLQPDGTTYPERLSCNPDNCQLGFKDPGCCAIKNIAATIDSQCAAEHDRLTEQRLTREILSHLSDRLGAILQTLAGTQQALPKLLAYLQELPLIEGFVSIEHMLKHIHNDLERAFPPAEAPEGP